MLPSLVTSPKRRTPRVLLASFALVALLGLAGLAAFWRSANYEARLQEILVRLDREDPDWNWDAYLRKRDRVLPENSAEEIVALLQLTNLRETIPQPSRHAWGKRVGELYREEKVYWYEDFVNSRPNGLMPERMRRLVEPVLAEDPGAETIRRLRALRRVRQGQFPHQIGTLIHATLLPDIQGGRTMANLLEWDARVRLTRQEPAYEHIAGMLGICRAYQDDPFLISNLVRLAIARQAGRLTQAMLAQGDRFDADQLRQLQDEFLREEAAISLRALIRAERAILDRTFADLQSGRLTLSRLVRQPWVIPVNQNPTGWKWADQFVVEYFPAFCIDAGARPGNYVRERAALHEFLGAVLDWSDSPEAELMPRLDRWRAEGSPLTPFGRRWFHSFAPADRPADYPYEFDFFQRIAHAHLEARGQCRAAATILAAERYRLDHRQWPTRWEQLAPKYLPSVLHDPYSGRPLHLKALPDGLAVYSVGRDGQDDGGAVGEDPRPRHDLGLRLWDPDRRRQQVDRDAEEYLRARKAEEVGY